jgi:hypothetical protein
VGALLNHCCTPNLCVSYAPDSHRHCFRALLDIRTGEEPRRSYTDMCKPTQMQRAALRTQFGFDSECARCCKDGPVDATLTKLGPADAAARLAFAATAYDRANHGKLLLAAHHAPAMAAAA